MLASLVAPEELGYIQKNLVEEVDFSFHLQILNHKKIGSLIANNCLITL